jgi:hypothetical protein
MVGAAQAVPSGSDTTVLWDASGLIQSGGNGWDDLGCSVFEGGWGIQVPPGIYAMHFNLTLSASSCSGGWYRAYGANMDENDVPLVSGWCYAGEPSYISWDDITDVGSYDKLMINIYQTTGQTLHIEEAVIGLARLCDGHGGGGG